MITLPSEPSTSPSTSPAASAGTGIERRSPDWDGLWDDCVQVDCVVDDIEGTLPKGLVGSLYRNGPGKRSLGTYFFDGDGMIRRLRFESGGRVSYRSRYVHTPKYLAEINADQPRVRSAGTQLPGGALANFMRMPANEANTHVLPIGGRMLALFEGGAPYQIDPESLETIGLDNFAGELSPKVPFSAHPHYDPETGELFNFGVMPAGKKPRLCTFKFDANGKFSPVATVELPHFTFLHDFALSENWMAFPLPNVSANLPKMMLGFDTVFGSLSVDPDEPTRWVMISRDGTQVRRYSMPAMFPGHIIAAREEGDELVVDCCSAPDWDEMVGELKRFRTAGFDYVGGQRCWRIRFDLTGTRVTRELLCDLPADFPRHDDRLAMHRVRYGYIAANPRPRMGGIFRGLLKLDLQTGKKEHYDFGERCAANEPVFVPDPARSGEDEGWILQPFHDGARRATNVAVFDAQAIEGGPVATLRLPAMAGMTFHGTWVAG